MTQQILSCRKKTADAEAFEHVAGMTPPSWFPGNANSLAKTRVGTWFVGNDHGLFESYRDKEHFLIAYEITSQPDDLVVLPKGVVIECRSVLAFLHGLACIEQNHSDETRAAVHNVFKEIDSALSLSKEPS